MDLCELQNSRVSRCSYGNDIFILCAALEGVRPPRSTGIQFSRANLDVLTIIFQILSFNETIHLPNELQSYCSFRME